MTAGIITHEDKNSGAVRGLSGACFKGFPRHQVMIGEHSGVFVDEDFINLTDVTAGFADGFEWRGATIEAGGKVGGSAKFTTGTTAYNTGGICSGNGADLFSSIAFAKTDPRFAMEARLQINRVTDFSLFVGVCKTSGDFDALLNGSGVVPTNEGNLFGLFYTSGGDLKADAKYVTDAPALQSLGTGLGTALAADTYIKLGLRYESGGGKPKLEYVVNGEVVASVTKDQLATATTGGDLKAFVLVQNHNTTAIAMHLDRFSYYSDVVE